MWEKQQLEAKLKGVRVNGRKVSIRMVQRVTAERTINDCSAFVRFAKPFRRMFYTAILFAFGLSIINILLPRVIQVLWIII